MDGQIKTELLETEVQIIVKRLTGMKPLFMSADVSSFLKCKSYYQQVVNLRKRFFEILPVLQCRLDEAISLQLTINAKITVLAMEGKISLLASEQDLSSFTQAPEHGKDQSENGSSFNPILEQGLTFNSVLEQGSFFELTSNPVLSSPAEIEQALSNTESFKRLEMLKNLKSSLKQIAEEVHNTTTDMEEKYFALEAEYNKKQMLEFITDPILKDLNGNKSLSSSITLNINGSITLKISNNEFGSKSLESSNLPFKKFLNRYKSYRPETDEPNKNNEAENEEIHRRKKLFYNSFAETTLYFESGKTLKVCGCSLIEKSSAFHDIIIRSKKSNIKHNFKKFKLFLDCLMEFQDISVGNALQIFPIACEYKVKKFTEKLIGILKPVEMNENVALLFNMAVSSKNEELVGIVMKFLSERGQIFAFFNEERYYFLLEVESVQELLNYFEIDSFLLKRIFQWAENYLKKRGRPIDLKSFFTEYRLMEKLAAALFESFGVDL